MTNNRQTLKLVMAHFRWVVIVLGSALCCFGVPGSPTLGQKPKAAARSAESSRSDKSQDNRTAKEKDHNSPAAASADPSRDRALMIAGQLAESKELDDPLEAAMMRADFAGLLCKCGRKTEALATITESIRSVAARLREEGASTNGYYALFDAINALDQRERDCDPSSAKAVLAVIAKSLSRRRNSADDRAESAAGQERVTTGDDSEPPVVPDAAYGTAPSNAREIPAEILCGQAIDSFAANRLDEGESLLKQSLSYCVTVPYFSASSRLRLSRPQNISSLYLLAARRAASEPSGKEISALSFGLVAIPPDQREPAIGPYVDAVIALLQSPYSSVSSAQLVHVVQEAMPAIQSLHPSFLPRAQEWLTQSMGRLSPTQQTDVSTPNLSPQEIFQIAQTTEDSAERDQAYASLASSAMEVGRYDKAAEFVSKISGPELKTEMADELALFTINRSLYKLGHQSGPPSQMDILSLQEQIAKVSSLPIRIKLYTRLGKMAADAKNTTDATLILEEAARIAETSAHSPRQTHLLLGIAAAFEGFDDIRAAEVTREAVRSMNRSREQPASRWGLVPPSTFALDYGPSGRFPRLVIEDPHEYQRPYDFTVLGKLALTDFDGALLAAEEIKEKPLRFSAEYEICAAILYKGSTRPNHDRSIPPP